MSDLRAAAQQALEALEFMADQWGFTNKANRPERWQAIAALRAALAQQEQEPVANASTWFALVMNAAAELEDASHFLRDKDAKRVAISAAKHYRDAAKALYTHQPRRETEQEPVAWLLTGGSDVYLASEFSPDSEHEQEWTPLYAGPPRREWQGLAEDEAMELMNDTANGYWADEAHIQDFARAIEARLRKLNNS